MADIKSPGWLYAKGGLLFCVGLLAALLLILENPTWRTALLLGIAVWAFCRAYYFAFYVIEHYIDGSFKYSGLTAFVQHCLSRRRGRS